MAAIRPSRMSMKRIRMGGFDLPLQQVVHQRPEIDGNTWDVGDGWTQTFPFLLMEKRSAPQLSML